MKKIRLLLLVLIITFIPIKSLATELDSIKMNVNLQDNGDANFTNRFKYDDDEGTEHYFVLKKMADSKIENIKVIHNGKEMEFVGNWDVDWTFEKKAGKYGIVKNGNEYELCYGITEYGKNDFELSYTITNFIKQSNDFQFFNWEFISRDFSDESNSVTVEIEKENYGFNKENSKIWAFGYEGSIEFINGKIIAESNCTLDDSDYITILTKFEEPIFSTESKVSRDFEAVKKEALRNSAYENDNNGVGGETKEEPMPTFVKWFIGIVATAVVAILGIALSYQAKRVKRDDYEGTKIDDFTIKKSKYKKEYFRSIPYEGKIEDIFIIMRKYDGNFIKNYISAYLLKWIKEERITSVKYEDGTFFKKEKMKFKVIKFDEVEEGLEENIFNSIVEASGEDHILEEKEFSKWMKDNYKRFDEYFEDSEEYSRKVLIDRRYFTVEEKINTFSKQIIYTPTNLGEELIGNIVKFANYLKEYSLINERNSYNVNIWDNYMIFAALLGIAEEVEKEFKNIYPNYIEESTYDFYTIYWISHYSNSAYNSYGSVSSAGFGGAASSIGGGGGSFGGGGGGTR